MKHVNVDFKEYGGKYYCQYRNEEVFEFGDVRNKLKLLDEYSKYFGVFLEGDEITEKVTNNSEYTKTKISKLDIYYTDTDIIGRNIEIIENNYWCTSDSKTLLLSSDFDGDENEIPNGKIILPENIDELKTIGKYENVNAVIFRDGDNNYMNMYYDDRYIYRNDNINSLHYIIIAYQVLNGYKHTVLTGYFDNDVYLVHISFSPLFVYTNHIRRVIPLDGYTNYSNYFDSVVSWDINTSYDSGDYYSITDRIATLKALKKSIKIDSVTVKGNNKQIILTKFDSDQLSFDITYFYDNEYKFAFNTTIWNEEKFLNVLFIYTTNQLKQIGFNVEEEVTVDIMSGKSYIKSNIKHKLTFTL